MDLDQILDPKRLKQVWSQPRDRADAAPDRMPAPSTDRMAEPVPAEPGAVLRSLEQEIDRLFAQNRRAHVALQQGPLATLRARVTPAQPAAGAVDEVLDTAIDAALDEMEDLLEAFLHAGPWSAKATGAGGAG